MTMEIFISLWNPIHYTAAAKRLIVYLTVSLAATKADGWIWMKSEQTKKRRPTIPNDVDIIIYHLFYNFTTAGAIPLPLMVTVMPFDPLGMRTMACARPCQAL
jgi:hypothetical protein